MVVVAAFVHVNEYLFDPLWIIFLYYLSVEKLTLYMSVTYLLQHIRHFWTLFGFRSLKFPDLTMKVLRLIKSLYLKKGFIVQTL